MSNLVRHPVIGVILGLAALGLIYRLWTNPSALFLTLMITALFAVGLYFLLTRVVLPRRSGGMDSNYRKALKQSKARQKQQEAAKQRRRKKKSHLKVIDGQRKK
ncbi:SA1362 family protein [Natribacillus halophilus]|uniref:Uncharacterized protein n=1 Tax=Natribacillus halophilus TaxID=549003 RepID=A0A1G8JLP1_9BACI|nr:SA1362 family protein [Natribacillus halophilus]SDI31927.1 hypothetical protein SAMN04488123_101279 [Natribacillus halophilus]